MHHYSEDHEFALELRVSLIILFALCALATTTHVSIMLAGFAFGLVVWIGEPRRLARQLFGIIQVRELGEHPDLILLGAGLGIGAVLAHGVGRLFGQPVTLALLASAQLGVPVAAATLGTEKGLLAPGEPSALMLGAIMTIAATSIAGVLAARRQSTDESKAPSG